MYTRAYTKVKVGESLHTVQKCPHTDYAVQSFPLLHVDFCIINHALSLITDCYLFLLQSTERKNITKRKRNTANPKQIQSVISKQWCCIPMQEEFMIGIEENTNSLSD